MTAPPERTPVCVFPEEWERSEIIQNLGGPCYHLLFWSDSDIGFEHRCDRGESGVVICAPRLQIGDWHTLTWTNAPDGRERPTVRSSISCPDCGTHGFITEGRWTDA